MLAEQLAFRRVRHHGAIERTSIALNDAGNQVNMIRVGGFSDALALFAWQLDGAFEVAAKILAPRITSAPKTRAKVEPFRISADKRLGKHDEIRTLHRCIPREIRKFFKSSVSIEYNWCSLHDRRLYHHP